MLYPALQRQLYLLASNGIDVSKKTELLVGIGCPEILSVVDKIINSHGLVNYN